MHKVLEHYADAGDKRHRDWVAGLQLGLQQECERDCEHPWLLRQCNHGLEVPLDEESGHAHWTLDESSLSGHEP